MNRITLIGRLGKDPEITTTAAGLMATFRVATNEHWTDAAGEAKTHVEWHSLVCFDRLAEIARDYLHKGFEVYVEGRMRTSTWTDANGTKRTSKDVRVDELRMLRAPRGDPFRTVRAQLQSLAILAGDLGSGKRTDVTIGEFASMLSTMSEALEESSA